MRLCVCVCVCRGRCFHMGFPSSSAGRVCLQCRRPWFDSWVGKILWRRNRLPTPVFLGLPGVSHGKKSTRNAGDLSSIPGLGRSPGGRYGNPLQYSCLENPLGQRSLAGYSPWGLKETDVTKFSTYSTCFYIIKEKWMILISTYSVWSWAWQINFINFSSRNTYCCYNVRGSLWGITKNTEITKTGSLSSGYPPLLPS